MEPLFECASSAHRQRPKGLRRRANPSSRAGAAGHLLRGTKTLATGRRLDGRVEEDEFASPEEAAPTIRDEGARRHGSR